MRLALSLAALAAVALAGVAVAQDRTYDITVREHPAAPKGFDKVKLSKAVLGDTQIMLWRNAAINPDCTPVEGVTLSVLKAPEHGKATISNDPVFVAYPPANPRSACNSKKVPGHQAFYQADAGYQGRDHLVLQGSSPEGHVRQIDVDIEVRPAG